ncbi:peptidoglycan DD-metalloendopeptidase family protein [Pseudomonas sp. N040]|uniref:peptidoglycan DD-metalloendopeptidase family protein n=1 Tax=Pseudomonas sp. N040 TaxID=2785325 RepID=UPI0018A2F224|nr:peptidoglycan DD-metalloendopeptidase family protein [Pseudomonas sp. N040]MBF7728454.1 peptidoglycan DD-metalloendopeptidase family protein [Pseudomonas sp. N040]MBW7012094.1 peptidoglycan DD-metalloendopeptidase family protein [Pseudomonas sp. N040]
MTQSIKKAPIYPKAHLLAASGIAAMLSLSLLVFPSGEVEAKKTFMNLDHGRGESATADKTPGLLSFGEPDVDSSSPFPSGISPNTPASSIEADTRSDNPLNQAQTIALEARSISVTADKGDTLSTIFQRAGLTPETLHSALSSSKEARQLAQIKVGQVFEFELSSNGDLVEARSKLNELETVSLKRTPKGFTFKRDTIKPLVRSVYSHGVINSSLFVSAKRAGLSNSLLMDMANVFGYDIDFAQDLAKGDQFEVIYEEKVVNGRIVGTGNILAARFTNRGKTYTAVRYTNKQGVSGYYNAQGMSMRKAFLRTPVDFARISSRFSNGRKHPILNKIRAHQGVDYAAARGTPIKAAGDGKVILAGRKGGYGNTVILQHGSNYKTLYAHMQGFAKGIRSGSAVKQGQIIGYIGTTGLSTGPHLHYEFQVNGRHVDPLAQKKLMADPIASSEKAKFLQLSQPLMAQMDQEKASTLALNKP